MSVLRAAVVVFLGLGSGLSRADVGQPSTGQVPQGYKVAPRIVVPHPVDANGSTFKWGPDSTAHGVAAARKGVVDPETLNKGATPSLYAPR